MQKEILTNCEMITKMNQESQNQMLRTFTKLDISLKIDVFKEQKVVFHKLKNNHLCIENSILTYASFILAIQTIINKTNIMNLNVIKLRRKSSKTNVKRQKVLGYWAIVRTLKLEQNMSFRDIATYFAKYHKLEVSYSTVYELWNELENNI